MFFALFGLCRMAIMNQCEMIINNYSLTLGYMLVSWPMIFAETLPS